MTLPRERNSLKPFNMLRTLPAVWIVKWDKQTVTELAERLGDCGTTSSIGMKDVVRQEKPNSMDGQRDGLHQADSRDFIGRTGREGHQNHTLTAHAGPMNLL